MKITQPFIAALFLIAALQTTQADSSPPEEPAQPLPDGQVFIPPAQAPDAPNTLQIVEVRNNSTFSVFVVQKGLKETLPPKSTFERDMNQYPVSITPAYGTDTLKFVTLTWKTGACKQQLCLIVQ